MDSDKRGRSRRSCPPASVCLRYFHDDRCKVKTSGLKPAKSDNHACFCSGGAAAQRFNGWRRALAAPRRTMAIHRLCRGGGIFDCLLRGGRQDERFVPNTQHENGIHELRRRGAVFCSVTTCGVLKARHVTICKTIHESSDCTVSARIIRGSFVAATAPMLQASCTLCVIVLRRKADEQSPCKRAVRWLFAAEPWPAGYSFSAAGWSNEPILDFSISLLCYLFVQAVVLSSICTYLRIALAPSLVESHGH